MVIPDDDRLPRARRILRPVDFARVYRCRWSAADGPLVMYGVPRDPGAESRLGLSVSRRVGNAVVRNRWKRRLREAFRVVRAQIPTANDYVIVVRSGLAPTGAEGARMIEESIKKLAARVTGRSGYRRMPTCDTTASPRRRGRSS